MKRNTNLAKLSPSYLFPQINMRKKEFLAKHPQIKLISLGIGDTTEPLPLSIAQTLSQASLNLATQEGYFGYGSEQGIEPLRKKIAEVIYKGVLKPEEVFISDGAKCDISRFQLLFGKEASIALQNPTYPVYLEGSILQGVENIVPFACTPENDFFPDLSKLPRTDLIYFCSPNNPTGAVATKEQLKALVDFARKNDSIILFDSAYAAYIQDPALPRSIYEIEGAKDVAIEIGSFSKLAGFTGVRLGWTVVPESLKYTGGESVRNDWNRVTSTIFNGASILSQLGGLAVLEPNTFKEVDRIIHHYLENAQLIKEVLEKKGLHVFGGTNAPYLWVRFEGKKSWDVFQDLLEKAHIICTPGSGFGSAGESFARFSAFGHRENILEALNRLNLHL